MDDLPLDLRLPVHVRRPDGRLQVGVGPGAWVVDGWSPELLPQDTRTQVLRGLVQRAPRPPLPGPCEVEGMGPLAQQLRERLPGSSAGPGGERPVGGVQPHPSARAPSGRARRVVVLVSAYLVPVGTNRRSDLAGAWILPVVVQTGRVVVGPWTGPPRTPCLHCLDLRRRDQDAQWPELAVALDDPLTGGPPGHPAEVVELARSLTELLVAGVRQGQTPAPGLAYEVGAEVPHLVTRRWTVHPACPWHGPAG